MCLLVHEALTTVRYRNDAIIRPWTKEGRKRMGGDAVVMVVLW
jgi:hypothetical protein